MSRDQQPELSAPPKQEWVMPLVQRMDAGSAKDGANPNPDGILNPS